MKNVFIDTEYIKLGQLLKLSDMVSSGAEAKIAVAEGQVLLNGDVCLERGKKVHPGDIVSFGNEKVKVKFSTD